MFAVVLTGKISSEVVQKTWKGKDIAEFDMAVHRQYPNPETGEYLEETLFVTVTCWGGLARSAGAMGYKRRHVEVKFRSIKVAAWIGKDGEAHAKLEGVADEIEWVGEGPSKYYERLEAEGERPTVRGPIVKEDNGHRQVRKVAVF